ncbi:MAG TPA: hypothetical protein VF680_09245 [Allosphingosinicella sp.]
MALNAARTCDGDPAGTATCTPAELVAVEHRPIPHSSWPSEDPVRKQVDYLGELIADQAARVAGRSLDDATFIITTTSLSHAFQAWPLLVDRLVGTIERRLGVRPNGLLQVYLCTGWAFALRACARHSRSGTVVITIADVDFHDLDHLREHPLIGKQGYGLTTLVFELPADGDLACSVDGPFKNNGFKELILALRTRQREADTARTFVPFLKQELRRIVEASLGRERLGANLHHRIGHCFGSDPWIGVIDWLSHDSPCLPQRVLVGGFAYTGYIAHAEIAIPEHVRFEIHDREERQPTLRCLSEPVTPVEG